MLRKILSPESCAECRLCCVFDSSDIWEIPVFSSETAGIIREALPDTEFIRHGGGYILKTEKLAGNELFTCPALTDKGCMLGDSKPFDCRIWPFRIMEIGGRRAITVASLCSEIYNRPLSQLVEFLRDGLADEIFSYAAENPEIVKPYDSGYPVLLFEAAEK